MDKVREISYKINNLNTVEKSILKDFEEDFSSVKGVFSFKFITLKILIVNDFSFFDTWSITVIFEVPIEWKIIFPVASIVTTFSFELIILLLNNVASLDIIVIIV